MFFKRIKTISSEKFLTTVIEARSKQFSSEKIKTVGILFDYDQFVNYDYFRMLFTDLGLNDNRLRFIVFYEKENNQPRYLQTHLKEYLLEVKFHRLGFFGNLSFPYSL